MLAAFFHFTAERWVGARNLATNRQRKVGWWRGRVVSEGNFFTANM